MTRVLIVIVKDATLAAATGCLADVRFRAP